MEKIKNNRVVLLLILTVGVYLFLQYLTPLIAPALVAMLFVTIFGPGLQRLQKKLHIHRQVGAVLFLLFGGIIVIFLLWILGSFILHNLPQWMAHLDRLQAQMWELVDGLCDWMNHVMGMEANHFQRGLQEWLQSGTDIFRETDVSTMLDYSWSSVKWLGRVGTFVLIFIVSSVLLAKDYDEFMNKLLEKEECHVLLEVICGVIRYIAVYVKAQMILIVVNASVCSIVLAITGIPSGILWGLLAGVLDVFPFIGTGIVLIPLAILQLIGGYYVSAVVCVLLSFACVAIRDVLEPRLIGKRAGIRPIAVLLSLYVGIQLFGLWGIIKGPLGLVIIRESYEGITKRLKNN